MHTAFYYRIIVIIFVCTAALHAYEKQPHLSGWYPETGSALTKELTEQDRAAQTHYAAAVGAHSIRAIITPHAGLAYSGAVASSVYRLLGRHITRIILVAPDHAGGTRGVSLPSWRSFGVPNGSVAVAISAVRELVASNDLFDYNDAVFAREHSLEMQLPFIVHYLPDVSMVPLIVGSITCDEAHAIARHLTDFIDKDTLVVVTSDFTHYGSRFNFTPFADHQGLQVRRLDSQVVRLLEHGSCDLFAAFMAQKKPTICGRNPLKILCALREASAFGTIEPRFIAYARSGNPDQEASVSYVGMVFTDEKLSAQPIGQQLTQQEQRGLWVQARDTLINLFNNDYDATLHYPIRSLGLRRALGAFTTLRTTDNRLRGCIGAITSNEPLYTTIARVTRDAALHDGRFAPVTAEELSGLQLKLSILSRPKRVSSYRDIEIGRHGIILQRGNKRAVFLPEVAREQGWSLEHTLAQLSQKAGLAADAWQQPDTSFAVFESMDIDTASATIKNF